MGLMPPPPTAFARFGAGSWFVPPCRVLEPWWVEVGEGVVLMEHSWLSVMKAHTDVDPVLRFGDRVRFGRFLYVACGHEIVIEDDVTGSDNVLILDADHEFHDPAVPVIDQGITPGRAVRICRGAYLGAGCAITKGVTVGEGAYVGEGAVATRDVDPHTVVYGNPARVVRRHDPTTGSWTGWGLR